MGSGVGCKGLVRGGEVYGGMMGWYIGQPFGVFFLMRAGFARREQRMLEITTPRCLLRPMEERDFSAVCRYLQDAEVMHAWGHTLSDAEVRAWIARQQTRYATAGYGALAVTLRSNGELIGQCGLTMQECLGVSPLEDEGASPGPVAAGASPSERPGFGVRDLHVPEVGYMLARAFWGQGYAVEAAYACLRLGFASLTLPEIFACIKVGNTASCAVARRLGMRRCGFFYKHYRGEDMPHELYGLRAGDLLPRADLEKGYAVTWRC